MLHHYSAIIIILILAGNLSAVDVSKDETVRRTKVGTLLDHLLDDYDKHQPPKKDEPTEVQLGIYVISFYSISEQTMDYSVSMYFRQKWIDERLAYRAVQGRRNVTRLGESSWKRIWTPDTFLRNEKRASFHEVTVNNRLLRLYSSGLLWYVIKVSATLSCPMKLHKYPLDTQVCPMMFESFGYTMDNIYFSWQEKPVEIENGLQLPQFKLQSHFLYDCVQNYTAGSFPCLEIRFILRRDIGYFLIQVYVPSMLIVILSWVSFWINIEASPARVSIGLLTVLTMTTQSAGVNASLPRVSYIKAVDVWMSMCLIFVFVGLLEYALVNVLSRRKARVVARVREGFLSAEASQFHGDGVVQKQPQSKQDRHLMSNGREETGSRRISTAESNSVSEKGTPYSNKLTCTSPLRLANSCHDPDNSSPLKGLTDTLSNYSLDSSRQASTSPTKCNTLPRIQKEYHHHYHHHQHQNGNQLEVQSLQVVATKNKNQICIFKKTSKNRSIVTTHPSHYTGNNHHHHELLDGMRHAKEIDRMSRKLFPITFLLFNVFYWMVYALPYMHYSFGS